MPTPIATAEYMKLSVSERIQLVEDIWDSIAADAPNTVELSQAQKAELHRRVAAVPTLPQPFRGSRFATSYSRVNPDVGRAPSRGRRRASGSAGLV